MIQGKGNHRDIFTLCSVCHYSGAVPYLHAIPPPNPRVLWSCLNALHTHPNLIEVANELGEPLREAAPIREFVKTTSW